MKSQTLSTEPFLIFLLHVLKNYRFLKIKTNESIIELLSASKM